MTATTSTIGNNFLSLTGGNRISGIKWNPEVNAGGGVVDTTTNVPTRAVDNIPKDGKFYCYKETIPNQCGYGGFSTQTLIG